MRRPDPEAATFHHSPAGAWWRGAALYARSRALGRACAAAVLASLALATISRATVHVPFAPETTVVDLVLISPLVPAVLFVATLATPLARLEEIAVRRMRWLRAGHAAAICAATALTALAGWGRPVSETESLLVNSLLLVGLMLCGAVVSDGALPWLAPVTVSLICFFFGNSPDDGSVQPWALLLLGPRATTVGCAAVVLLLGCGGFVLRGPRGSSSARASRHGRR